MRWGVKAGPGVLLQDGWPAAGSPPAGRTTRCPAGCSRRRRTCAASTRSPARSRTSTPSAATSARRRRRRGRPVRRRDRAGHGPGRKGDTVVDRDEHIRPDSSVETLAKLRPIMGRTTRRPRSPPATPAARTTAPRSRSSPTPEKAAELGLRPLARLVSWGVAGVPPATMGIGPVPATAKALAQADVKLADVDLIELNEAFASQVLAVTREWGFTDGDFERTNVNGSGISLGHPVGATGGRILATLLREMDRRDARYGLETMCIGGGQGLAALFERVELVNGRVAIVTGAARGIGAATAQRLAADGFAVAVLDLKEDDARDTVRRSRPRVGGRWRWAPTSATPSRCRRRSTGSPPSSARRSCWSTTPASPATTCCSR